ncbi:hypothetical protein CYJ36_22470 [Bacillus sp. UMB0893]|nr:hypothetical protein CYJ36_22470 [Bacillus sp. UMB0893]
MKLHEWRKKTSVFFLNKTGIEPVSSCCRNLIKPFESKFEEGKKLLLKQRFFCYQKNLENPYFRFLFCYYQR